VAEWLKATVLKTVEGKSQSITTQRLTDNSSRHYDQIQTNDPVLRSLNEAWAGLPEHVRKAILMMAGITIQ
jgi:hypothetical protein